MPDNTLEKDLFIDVITDLEDNLATISFSTYIKRHFKMAPYAYQRRIAENVIEGKTRRYAILSSRQIGKSMCMAMLSLYMMDIHDNYHIGVFAPKEKLSAKIIFKRARDMIKRSKYYSRKTIKDSETYIELENGSSLSAYSASENADIEGPSLHLALVDEAQKVSDTPIKKSITYMLGHFNGILVLIGTAGYQRCYFYETLYNKQNYHQFFLNPDEASLVNPDFKTFRDAIKEEHGVNSDEYKSQIMCKWILRRGMYVTKNQLDKLEKTVTINTTDFHVAGLDTAKAEDRTVMTIMNDRGEIVYWLFFENQEDYEEQYDYIVTAIKDYNVGILTVDSTGTQDAIVDSLARRVRDQRLNCDVRGVAFMPATKHRLFKELELGIQKQKIVVPDDASIDNNYSHDPSQERARRMFREEMLALEKEYRGQIMKISHPAKRGAHDDFPDSLALAYDSLKEIDARAARQEFVPIKTHNRRVMRGGFDGENIFGGRDKNAY